MAICYLCGTDGADTTEHVVPRCLYPGKLPDDVITLPAHLACNKVTSKDEEVFRNHVSVAIQPDNPGFPLWQKTWKAIHRPEAAWMQNVFYSEMISVPVVDDDGVVRASPVAARLKNERGDRVLAKIVKGLFTSKTGELLPSEKTLWRFGQADQYRAPLPNAFKVHDVLDVFWGRAADEPLAMIWILGFHRVAWFHVTTMPKSRPMPGREAAPMMWPGP
ncbi:MAG: hypothetical protein AMXMBFR56_47780 [Polyangiaceae bacterium]